MALMLENRMYF